MQHKDRCHHMSINGNDARRGDLPVADLDLGPSLHPGMFVPLLPDHAEEIDLIGTEPKIISK